MKEYKVLTYRTSWGPIKVGEQHLRAALKPHELLVKVSHISLNPLDVKMKALSIVPCNYTVGREYVGTVEQVGRDLAARYKVGDRVCGCATGLKPINLGEYVVVSTKNFITMKPPTNLTDVEAAAFPMALSTAACLLEQAKLDETSNILILGGGTSVGMFTIQLAKLHYKVKTVVVSCSEGRADSLKSLGADETLDYKTGDLSAKLQECAGRVGRFKLIADTSGGYEALNVCNDILVPTSEGGVYATIAGDNKPAKTYHRSTFDMLRVLPRMTFRMKFGKHYGIDYRFVSLRSGSWEQMVLPYLENSQLKVPIDTVYPVSEYQKAWDKISSGSAKGKIVIDFSGFSKLDMKSDKVDAPANADAAANSASAEPSSSAA